MSINHKIETGEPKQGIELTSSVYQPKAITARPDRFTAEAAGPGRLLGLMSATLAGPFV